MKILQIHNFYQTFGGEDMVVSLEKELLEAKGHKIVQYIRHNEEIKGYSFFKKVEFFLNTIYSRNTAKDLSRSINENRPDVAHIHNVFPLISPSVYYCLRRHNIPVVQTVHNYRFLCPNGLFYTKSAICERCKKGNVLQCFLNKCYKDSFLLSGLYALTFWIHRRIKTFQNKVDIFVTLSYFTKDKLVEGGFPKDKIETEGNFLLQDGIRKTYDKENYAVFMGRLSSEKGLITLLKAFQKVNKLKIKIVGKGKLEQELKRYIKKNKMLQVEMVDFISGNERLELLGKAKFSIVPSQCYEHFPISVLESFAAGTAVIASKIGGLPEIVEDGKNGLLFEPGNSEDLAEKIIYLYENPDKALEMGKYAHKCVEEKLTPQRHYNRLMEIYEKAIEGNEDKRKSQKEQCCLQN